LQDRRFRRTQSDDDKRAWADKVKEMRLLYEEKNTRYWRQELAASKGDTKRPWRTFQGILTSDGGTHTADNFAVFFRDKVEAVRNSTAATPLYNVPHSIHGQFYRKIEPKVSSQIKCSHPSRAKEVTMSLW